MRACPKSARSGDVVASGELTFRGYELELASQAWMMRIRKLEGWSFRFSKQTGCADRRGACVK